MAEEKSQDATQAMNIIRDEVLEKEGSLKALFKKAMLKAHPDKGGNPEVFSIVNKVYESLTPVLGGNATTEDRIALAKVLNSLDETVREELVKKIIKEQPRLLNANLLNPVTYSVSNTYKYKLKGGDNGADDDPFHKGRAHQYTVQGSSFLGLRDRFKQWRGDTLKTMILRDFKARIENTFSHEDLKALKEELTQTDEYPVVLLSQICC